jgi:hypothetical protein
MNTPTLNNMKKLQAINSTKKKNIFNAYLKFLIIIFFIFILMFLFTY